MNVVVHQLEGVSTIPALPLAAGLLVASARRDPSIAAAASLSIHTARLDPDTVAGVTIGPTCSRSRRTRGTSASRSRSPGARGHDGPAPSCLFGGPSVPRRPERAARFLREHPYVDALAFGEGEMLFREVLRALLEGRPLDGVAGLALRATARPEGAMLTAPRARIADFTETASPYLDGAFDSLVTADAPPPAAIVETNRGCPFACTFCDWGQAVQSQVPRAAAGAPARRARLDRAAADPVPLHRRRQLRRAPARPGHRPRDRATASGRRLPRATCSFT